MSFLLSESNYIEHFVYQQERSYLSFDCGKRFKRRRTSSQQFGLTFFFGCTDCVDSKDDSSFLNLYRYGVVIELSRGECLKVVSRSESTPGDCMRQVIINHVRYKNNKISL